MKKEKQHGFRVAMCVLIAFGIWTAAICFIDVQPIGPQGSTVGFAAINQFVHNLTGVHMSLYTVTDWLGLVPFGFAVGFALLGLMQWVKRKNLLDVDYSILVLGGFYVIVMAVYVLFERFAVNYRPILIGGILEASYPSSTTMLVMCVMPTAVIQCNTRIKNDVLRRCVAFGMTAFSLFMVIGRLVSGVHWFSDIIGGALFSGGIVMIYSFISNLKNC